MGVKRTCRGSHFTSVFGPERDQRLVMLQCTCAICASVEQVRTCAHHCRTPGLCACSIICIARGTCSSVSIGKRQPALRDGYARLSGRAACAFAYRLELLVAWPARQDFSKTFSECELHHPPRPVT